MCLLVHKDELYTREEEKKLHRKRDYILQGFSTPRRGLRRPDFKSAPFKKFLSIALKCLTLQEQGKNITEIFNTSQKKGVSVAPLEPEPVDSFTAPAQSTASQAAAESSTDSKEEEVALQILAADLEEKELKGTVAVHECGKVSQLKTL